MTDKDVQKVMNEVDRDMSMIVAGIAMMIGAVIITMIPPFGGWGNTVLFCGGMLLFVNGMG